ncbi:MAG TPA: alpha-ketoglutarate-dependent dioxygenase AlkB [Myxococcota bacterium]|nr:alpha-ketoglutarate-dependent dioxygenase AlkB [Myxococcota bacterium]
MTQRRPRASGDAGGAVAPDPTDCACTGVRWCGRCLDPARRRARGLDEPLPLPAALGPRVRPFEDAEDPLARAPWPAGVHRFDPDRQCAPDCPGFRGLRLYRDVVSEVEAARILRTIEATPFQPAQSGKRKQHFGPRINFSKRRIQLGGFSGIPDYAREIEARVRARVEADAQLDSAEAFACLAAFRDFSTTDVFVLRYLEAERSNLDFHADDDFGYGEVILDLSLEADGVLTFGRIPDGPGRATDGESSPRARAGIAAARDLARHAEACFVRVPLPARSVAVLHGDARWHWQHAVLARDVVGRRTSVTLRTLSPALRDTEIGREVLDRTR